jgi:hypothetical protein
MEFKVPKSKLNVAIISSGKIESAMLDEPLCSDPAFLRGALLPFVFSGIWVQISRRGSFRFSPLQILRRAMEDEYRKYVEEMEIQLDRAEAGLETRQQSPIELKDQQRTMRF